MISLAEALLYFATEQY